VHGAELGIREPRTADLDTTAVTTLDTGYVGQLIDFNRRSDMALPTLTPEQRAEALAKAQAARKERSELLASVKAGKVTIAQLLDRKDNVVKKTKVSQIIKALPGYGPAKAAAVMEEAGIDDNRRVGGLGDQQRKKLLDAVAG
jgi:S13-like H2TH domain